MRDLASIFKSRIEMRQIGVRDEARRLGGFGRCGRYYCCRGVINDFDPVTLKMVKEQHLAPGSPKISGGCGRLMCCLRYERDFYKEASKEFPKIGTRIEMGEGRGKGKVIAVDIFHSRVTLVDKEGDTTTVTLEDFKKGRITDVGTDDTDTALDDYWRDAESGMIEGDERRRGKTSREDKMPGKYYITTAIDYVNSPPHIGTAYEKISADVFARFQQASRRRRLLPDG